MSRFSTASSVLMRLPSTFVYTAYKLCKLVGKKNALKSSCLFLAWLPNRASPRFWFSHLLTQMTWTFQMLEVWLLNLPWLSISQCYVVGWYIRYCSIYNFHHQAQSSPTPSPLKVCSTELLSAPPQKWQSRLRSRSCSAAQCHKTSVQLHSSRPGRAQTWVLRWKCQQI